MRSKLLLLVVCVAGLAGCGKRPTQSVALDVSAEARAQVPQPAASAAKPDAGAPFAFPKDEGGKLLATLLPADAASTARPQAQAQPRPLAAPAALETPDLHLPFEAPGSELPRVAVKEDPRKKVRPRMLPSDPPLSRQAYDITPERQDLPTSPLTRVYGVDVEQVPAVPTLSQPLPDRVSLEDPTAAFSLASVLVTPAPERSTPVAPWFLNLPDPFEHHRVVKIQAIPPEDTPPPQ